MTQKDKARVNIFDGRFRTRASQSTPGLRVVVSYVNEHCEVVLEQTAMEIAATLNISDATVIRAIQALGFTGLHDLKRTLGQWPDPIPSSDEKISMTVSSLTSDVNAAADFVLEGHLYICNVLSKPEDHHTFAQAVALLVQARQVAISGTSALGTLADYTARLFNRIGLPAVVLGRTGAGLAEQLVAFQRDDVPIMMMQKFVYREGLAMLREARRLGIPVILLINTLDSRFNKDTSVVIHVPHGDGKGKTPLYGTVLLCLEMIVWSVASAVPQRAVKITK